MQSHNTFVLVATVVVIIIFIGGLATFLRLCIRNRRKFAEQAARNAEVRVNREALRGRNRRSRDRLPEAIPVEVNTIHGGPVLGNAVIKDASILRKYESELVRVDVPTSSSGALASGPNSSNRHGTHRTTARSRGVHTAPGGEPPASAQYSPTSEQWERSEVVAFPEDLACGGYVIVEYPQEPVGLRAEAVGNPGSVSSAQQAPHRRNQQEAHTLEFYRHQTSSVFYGASQYYSSPRQAQRA
ncbi:hypothetical protein LSCM1_01545 [Leishmania martiniquensis]|uniref:Uncharacterized protein n=1 Tax=Leishmania martiniquensis TaxID=1580590 RepID=A0A836KEX7_9TRYP|nr:hypothetical protein LSCM1_01545 [Leishmania martiniquensis]